MPGKCCSFNSNSSVKPPNPLNLSGNINSMHRVQIKTTSPKKICHTKLSSSSSHQILNLPNHNNTLGKVPNKKKPLRMEKSCTCSSTPENSPIDHGKSSNMTTFQLFFTNPNKTSEAPNPQQRLTHQNTSIIHPPKSTRECFCKQ